MGWVHVLFYIMLYSLIDMYNVTIINESINHVSASRICPDSGMLAQWCGFGEPWCVSYDGRMTMTRGYPGRRDFSAQ